MPVRARGSAGVCGVHAARDSTSLPPSMPVLQILACSRVVTTSERTDQGCLLNCVFISDGAWPKMHRKREAAGAGEYKDSNLDVHEHMIPSLPPADSAESRTAQLHKILKI
eukprot:1144702-Pelagomonas_calceolata.AAC.4